MGRRQAREVALEVLFQIDLCHSSVEDALSFAIANAGSEDKGLACKAIDYAEHLVNGTLQHLKEIDALLEAKSQGWTLARMATVDRNLLRIAAFEMIFSEENIDVGIAINEAVEIAKQYSSSDSSRYVNGVLDALAKEYVKRK